MSDLQIDIRPNQNRVVIALSGGIGIDDGPQLEREVQSVLESDPSLVVIDMSRLTFISSVGMSMLVKLHRSLKNRGGQVRIVAPPADVFGALDRAHLIEIIPVYSSLSLAFGSESGSAEA